MIIIDQKNEIKAYDYTSSYTDASIYATSNNRWIYFIENSNLPSDYNNVIRVYDKAILQNDFIFNTNLSFSKLKGEIYKSDYKNLHQDLVGIDNDDKVIDLSEIAANKSLSLLGKIALELENQYIRIDGFINFESAYGNYSSSCLDTKNKFDPITTKVEFLNNRKPNSFEFYQNHSQYSFNMSYSKSYFSIKYELILKTIFKEKEYKTPITLEICR